MTWIIPGREYSIDIEGVKIFLDPLTIAERIEFAKQVNDLKKDESSLSELYDLIGKKILRIEGLDALDMNPTTILAYQSNELVLKIMRAIMDSGTIDETLVKN